MRSPANSLKSFLRALGPRPHNPMSTAASVSLVALAVISLGGVAVAQTTGGSSADPFTPAVGAGNAFANFLIWAIRMLGFGGLAFSAFRAFFKKFDWVLLASVIGGLLVVALAPNLINWLFSLGGLTNANSIATYTP